MTKAKLILDVLLGKAIVITKATDSKIDVYKGRKISKPMMVNSLASALKNSINI